jgi:hypothetical protein
MDAPCQPNCKNRRSFLKPIELVRWYRTPLDRGEGSVVLAKGWDCKDGGVKSPLRGTGVVDAVELWTRFPARWACVKRMGGKVG